MSGQIQSSQESNGNRFSRDSQESPVPRLMFFYTVLWTGLLGAMLHLGNPETDEIDQTQWVLMQSLLAMYPVFIFELILIRKTGAFGRRFMRHIIPPLRIAARDPQTWTKIWLPWVGTQVVDRRLRLRVENAFMQPMLIVTLLVLPLLVLDFLVFKDYIESTPTLRLASAIGETIIWVAFTVEFIVMCCLSDKKVEYCKQNWIDLVVIILPLFAFLRFLRLGRLTKLTRFTRMGNVYRLRGVTVKVRRAVMVWELVNRLLRPENEKRLRKLELEYEEKREELESLRAEIDMLRHTLTTAAQNPAAEDTFADDPVANESGKHHPDPDRSPQDATSPALIERPEPGLT